VKSKDGRDPALTLPRCSRYPAIMLSMFKRTKTTKKTPAGAALDIVREY
jgi:hypothetical protein